jgi:hypothetical protein
LYGEAAAGTRLYSSCSVLQTSASQDSYDTLEFLGDAMMGAFTQDSSTLRKMCKYTGIEVSYGLAGRGHLHL